MSRVQRLILPLVLLTLFSMIDVKSVFAANQASPTAIFVKSPNQDTIGPAFADMVNRRDLSEFEKLVDVNQLAKKIAYFLEKENSLAFIGQLEKALKSNLMRNFFISLDQSNGEAYYRKVITISNQKRALIYFDFGEQGLNFLELVLDPNTSKVIDIYVHTGGELITQSMAKAMGMLMPESSNLFKRLLGREDVNLELVNQFREFGTYVRSGEADKALRLLNSLPEEIKQTRLILTLMVLQAGSVSEEAYSDSLSKLDKHFGNDPELFLVLMDHYFNTHEYGRAINGLRKLNQRFEGDPAIHFLLSVSHSEANQLADALKSIDAGIALKDDDIDMYYFKIDLLNRGNQYAAMIKLIDLLNTRFAQELTAENFLSENEYQSFANSVEFKNWAQTH